jgi:2-polyprenyl-3-methyl-5-hydroxy-6-metoxy-1,4-benzoquinol methylase
MSPPLIEALARRAQHDPYNRWHPLWPLDSFCAMSHTDTVRNMRAYPVRWLRYWFMDHFLQCERGRRQKPLAICEVGVGGGHLLAFMKRANEGKRQPSLSNWIETWDAVSRHVDRATLRSVGYDTLLEVDLEDPALALPRQYDVLILLHVLEHLREPETSLARLLPWLKAGGVVIGGGPTLPDFIRPVRERQLRKDAEPFGHVSVISSRRLKKAARQLELRLEFLTGAYFIRMTGTFLEQYSLWLRLNLMFGACCPNWPGEHYWVMRRNG